MMNTKKNIKLAILGILIMATVSFAQLPHIVTGYLQNPDSSIPTGECLTYKVYIVGGPVGDTLYFVYPGSSATCDYSESGQWAVNIGALENGYSTGDSVVVVFNDTCESTEGFAGVRVTTSIADDAGLILLEILTVIEEAQLPRKNEVISASPNPFNSAVSIQTAKHGDFQVEVFDIIGKRIDSFTKLDTRNIYWEVTDTNISSGVYFLKIRDLNTRNTEFLRVVYQK